MNKEINKQAVMSLLKKTGISNAGRIVNTTYLDALELALLKDSKKTIFNNYDNEQLLLDIDPSQPIARNIIHEMAVIQDVIRFWISSALNPLLGELNRYNYGEQITLSIEGVLCDGVIGLGVDIDAFIACYEDKHLTDIQQAIEGWRHTLSAIHQGDALIQAIGKSVSANW